MSGRHSSDRSERPTFCLVSYLRPIEMTRQRQACFSDIWFSVWPSSRLTSYVWSTVVMILCVCVESTHLTVWTSDHSFVERFETDCGDDCLPSDDRSCVCLFLWGVLEPIIAFKRTYAKLSTTWNLFFPFYITYGTRDYVWNAEQVGFQLQAKAILTFDK